MNFPDHQHGLHLHFLRLCCCPHPGRESYPLVFQPAIAMGHMVISQARVDSMFFPALQMHVHLAPIIVDIVLRSFRPALLHFHREERMVTTLVSTLLLFFVMVLSRR